MTVAQVTLEIPDEILADVLPGQTLSKQDLSKAVLMLLAAKLYETRRLSSSQAAAFAGVSRVEFNQRVGEYGVSVFDLTPEELEQDYANARRCL